MRIWIKNGWIVDPGRINGPGDLVIAGGKIEEILDSRTGTVPLHDRVIEANGYRVVPGLIDVHVHLREPGHEHKETIETGLRAAAAGGFTAVCCMPNTTPVNDHPGITRFILDQARKAGLSKVFPVGAVTVGSKGNLLTDMAALKQAGAVAVSDDGLPIASSLLMRQALALARTAGLPVFSHAEDLELADGGVMNEGPAAVAWGLKGIPNASESVMVARDIALAGLTGARLHICHVSCAESVELIRNAKQNGIPVTCETAPHYFTLTDMDITDRHPRFKMNPPLRSEKDRQAVIEGLCDGTVDMIATDHAPHSSREKDLPFETAAFGIIGLETAVPLSLKLVQDGYISFETLICKLSKNPAKLLGIDNDIKPGNMADITIIDTETPYEIRPEQFESKSRNTPFDGMMVIGAPVITMVDGRIVYSGKKGPVSPG